MNNIENSNEPQTSADNLSTLSSLPLLLLEIGTEEIPARFFPGAISKLKENTERIFSESNISFTSIKTLATPRRLSLIAEINPLQKAAEKEIWGPPVNIAFDNNGKPTKAAEAFTKTHGLDIRDLIKKKRGKGIYVAAVIKESAQQTEDLLPEILPGIILSLNFPKSMRWGNGNIRFARPIHWILATYNNKKVVFEVDGLKSSNITRGHRFLSPAAYEIKDTKAYANLLRNNFVILDPDERKKIIVDGAKRLTAPINASIIEDDELLRHVTYLVEYPVPVLGTFPADYLHLPRELLTTVMKGHQKYFAVEDNQHKLTNYFVIISNTKQDNAVTVKKGAERVIKARFEDARFYYEEDSRIPLEKRTEDLKRVIYHEKLGNLYDKSLRIASIAGAIVDKCFQSEQIGQLEHFKEDVHTAAMLSKTDLVSGVVGEFPELQGIMGSYYALHNGYSEEIAKALSEQYLPAYSGDRLPKTDIGTILSLSDKFDNLASFFMLGLTPTGTEDPFALRRQALGIISMLIDKRYDINISEILDATLQLFHFQTQELKLGLKDDLVRFFEQRIEPLFHSYGYPLDSISAVMSFLKDKPLYTTKDRLDAIQKFKEDPDYESFILAIKRVNNIAPKDGYELRVVNYELFQQEEEKKLCEAVEAITHRIDSLLDENKYYETIKTLMTLKESINSFFDNVLVMDKNEDIKQNRLSLIKSIQKLAFQIADFSRLA